MSLDPRRFSANEYVNTDWTLTVEAGTSIEDVLNPAFLANVAPKLNPYDHIRVRIDTGEWYAELMVLDCGRTWVKTLPLVGPIKMVADEPNDVDSHYEVSWGGPHLKFRVIRKSDKQTVKEGCASKQDANVWLSQHLLTL